MGRIYALPSAAANSHDAACVRPTARYPGSAKRCCSTARCRSALGPARPRHRMAAASSTASAVALARGSCGELRHRANPATARPCAAADRRHCRHRHRHRRRARPLPLPHALVAGTRRQGSARSTRWLDRARLPSLPTAPPSRYAFATAHLKSSCRLTLACTRTVLLGAAGQWQQLGMDQHEHVELELWLYVTHPLRALRYGRRVFLPG
jgi:hypothetical protein